MHPTLAVRRLEVLQTRLEIQKTTLPGWLETLDTHLYRLYLMTGNDDFLLALPVINRLRGEAETLSAHDQTALEAIEEFGEQLRRIVAVLTESGLRA